VASSGAGSQADVDSDKAAHRLRIVDDRSAEQPATADSDGFRFLRDTPDAGRKAAGVRGSSAYVCQMEEFRYFWWYESEVASSRR